MIDIITHFFILYPLLTLVKEKSRTFTSQAICSAVILFIAAIFTNFYMMDVSIVQTPSDVNLQNYYEVFETTPQAFMSLN